MKTIARIVSAAQRKSVVRAVLAAYQQTDPVAAAGLMMAAHIARKGIITLRAYKKG